VIATLFDFDGVLVDSEPVHLAAFNDVLAPHGVVIAADEYAARYLSLDDAGVFGDVLSRRGKAPTDDEVKALVASKAPRFLERFADAFRVFPGAIELVARRAARGPVGIVSGALEQEIVFALGKMGLLGKVAFIVSADCCTLSKPEPAPYLLALEKLRIFGDLPAAVAIEDSLGGIASARGAGLRCVAVAHSYPLDDLAQAGADRAVSDLAQLTDELLDGA
jgi:beta-phosphoglucomutase-like phosphatase (HAD superfamily)